MKYKNINTLEMLRLRESYINQGMLKTEAALQVCQKYDISLTTFYFILSPSRRKKMNERTRQYHKEYPEKHVAWNPEKTKEYYKKNQSNILKAVNAYHLLVRHPERIIPFIFNGDKSLSLEDITDRLANKAAGRQFKPETIIKATHSRSPPVLVKQGDDYFLHPHYRNTQKTVKS